MEQKSSNGNAKRIGAFLTATLYLGSLGLLLNDTNNKKTIPKFEYNENDDVNNYIALLSSYAEQINNLDIGSIITPFVVDEDGCKYLSNEYTPYCVLPENKDMGVTFLSDPTAPIVRYGGVFGTLDGYIGLNKNVDTFLKFAESVKEKAFYRDPEVTRDAYLLANGNGVYILPSTYTLCELTKTDPNATLSHLRLVRIPDVLKFTEVAGYCADGINIYDDLNPDANYVGIRNDVLSVIKTAERLEDAIKTEYSLIEGQDCGRK